MSIHRFPEKPSGPLTWNDRLRHAHSERDVVDVVRDYLATVTIGEIALLPESCRPRRLGSASEIAGYAFDLVRHQIDAAEALPIYHKLIRFFADANTRLSELLSQKANDGQDEGRESA